MRIRELLSEKLSFTEFKFGFELEAIFTNKLNLIDPPGEADDQDVKRYLERTFRKWFDKVPEIQNDGSIEVYDNTNESAFEFPSPVMNLSPRNISKTIDFLGSLNKLQIKTNSSCGFHVHVSFPSLNAQDAMWLVFVLAFDISIQEKILYFKRFHFLDEEYATVDFLNEIVDYAKDESWDDVAYYLSNEKYRILRIHPQGTLEWRGPRNFLEDQNIQDIKSFFFLLIQFVRWISKTLDSNNIDGVPLSRDQFNQTIAPMSKAKFKSNRKDNRFHPNLPGDIIKKAFIEAPWLKKAKFKNSIIGFNTNGIVWKGGEWIDGEWLDGEWRDGKWRNGIWHNGEWITGEWRNGLWHDGFWHSGVWHDGEWQKGHWYNGTWYDGTWKSGEWRFGYYKDENGRMTAHKTPPMKR